MQCTGYRDSDGHDDGRPGDNISIISSDPLAAAMHVSLTSAFFARVHALDEVSAPCTSVRSNLCAHMCVLEVCSLANIFPPRRHVVQDAVLSLLCLGDSSWVPSSVDAPVAHRCALQESSMNPFTPPRVLKHVVKDALHAVERARCKRLLPAVHSATVPWHLRYHVKDLHPCVADPNKMLEATVGYSMRVRNCCAVVEHDGLDRRTT
jgi:hypothetical protein